MYLVSFCAVLYVIFIAHLGVHSHLGYKSLGIRVRYVPGMFLYSALLDDPFSTALPFRVQVTWNYSQIYVSAQCTTERFRSVLPFGGTNHLDYIYICFCTVPFFGSQLTWN